MQVHNEALAASDATADGVSRARDTGAGVLQAAKDLPGRALAKGEALAAAMEETPEKVRLQLRARPHGDQSAPRSGISMLQRAGDKLMHGCRAASVCTREQTIGADLGMSSAI